MKEYMKDSNWIWNPHWSAKDKDTPRIMLFRKRVELKSGGSRGGKSGRFRVERKGV